MPDTEEPPTVQDQPRYWCGYLRSAVQIAARDLERGFSRRMIRESLEEAVQAYDTAKERGAHA